MLGRTKLKIRRYKKGSRDSHGHWVKGSPYIGTMTASRQPISGKELRALPEGRREHETYTLFSDDKLNTVLQDGSPDEVEIHDEWFELYSRSQWDNDLINHYEYVVQLVTEK